MGILVVDQFLKTLVDDIVQGDFTRDHRLSTDRAVVQQSTDTLEIIHGVSQGTDDPFVGGAEAEEVEFARTLEDTDDNRSTVVANEVDGQRTGLDVADTLEGHVGSGTAGQLLDFGNHVALSGIENHVGAALLGQLLTAGGHLDHDELTGAGSLGALQGTETDGAGPEDYSGFTQNGAGQAHGFETGSDRLDQGRGVQVGARRYDIANISRNVDVLGKSAIGHQTGKGQLFADIVAPFTAGNADTAMLTGVGSDQIADPHAGNIGANGNNLAGELVTKDGLAAMTGQRMGFGRNKDRTSEIFVKVRTADTTNRYLNLYFVGLGRCRHGDLFYADIFCCMPNCCFLLSSFEPFL